MASHLLLIASFLALAPSASSTRENPVSKVVQLLGELEAKVTKAGGAEDKAYKEFTEWCEDAARNAGFQIKTSTAEKEDLEATIAKAVADADAAATRIEELAAAIASGDADLKAATEVRAKEQGEFAASEAELVSAIDTLDRAIAIITREMQKNPALLQKVDGSNMQELVQGLSAVIDGAAFSGNDKQKLLALVQNQQSASDADDDLGAPAAATYKTHSTSIIDVLEDLKEKAEAELSDLRKAETNSAHNFAMLKQSLEMQAAADEKDLGEEKAAKAEAEESKAAAEGELSATVKESKAAAEGELSA